VTVECVVNISEGRDLVFLAQLTDAAGPVLLDLHRDPDHHRSVFTLAGEAEPVTDAVRSLAHASVNQLDLSAHQGAHPRRGVVDVVPFVPFVPGQLPSQDVSAVVALRDDFARWMSATLGVPTFLYGPRPDGTVRTLPQVRRHAFGDMAPDFGPGQPHPTAGATAVGARSVLVAYNVRVSSLQVARRVAPLARGPAVRALGLAVGEKAQVSCNLIDPAQVGPAQAYDAVRRLVEEAGGTVERAELVGLVPEAVLEAIPASRWTELGLSAEKTVEARLRSAARSGGGAHGGLPAQEA
jgi:glutamate formiminotransferase / 5-formyltetrahydrofolate cyclo-ligase